MLLFMNKMNKERIVYVSYLYMFRDKNSQNKKYPTVIELSHYLF